jgi:membrane protease YdiL (CAAX protease family)
MSEATVPNSYAALVERRASGVLTWSGPISMLFARSAFAVAAQGLVAAIYAARGSAMPWRDAAPWLPVYGTLIDVGCLCLLWRLARREGITLLDLIGFDRKRLRRDVLFGLALIPPSLLFIFGGNLAGSLLVYGNLDTLQIFEPLPLLPTLYAVLIFPLIWGITEQTTYNGYVLPRLQVLSGSTGFSVAVVALAWSFQHVVMPLTFDPDFMAYRLLSPVAFSTFIILVYLRVRRILPLATAHWLMDGGAAFVGSLWPLLK